MISKGRKKGTTRFALRAADRATKVEVVGSFNNWQPIRMRRQKDGAFVAIVPVPHGAHEYKFILDGEWAVDPDNSAWAMNPYGTLNSVLTVG